MREEREAVWVCLACGKRSRDRYGEDRIDRGWDESCMLNSALVYSDSLVMSCGRVIRIEEGGLAPLATTEPAT